MHITLLNASKLDISFMPPEKRLTLRSGNRVELIACSEDTEELSERTKVYRREAFLVSVVDDDCYLCVEDVGIGDSKDRVRYTVKGSYIRSAIQDWEYRTLENEGSAIHHPTGIEVTWKPASVAKGEIVSIRAPDPGKTLPLITPYYDSEEKISGYLDYLAYECIRRRTILRAAWDAYKEEDIGRDHQH